MNGGITHSESTFSSSKDQSINQKMRMNPLTCFTIKITLNVQYDIKKRMLYLQLIAIVLKTQAGERICMVLPEIND